jgi:heat shock protein 5
LSESEKETIQGAVKEHQEWLNANPEADKEDYENHLKDLQKTCDPIIAKIYKQTGGSAHAHDEAPEDPDL